ncbi:MAG: nitronate monooxygenase [Gammaproteobacteria bacterium]|jgi:nitronate monooxygenase
MKAKYFLGTDLPIIQSPMAGVQDNVLAAAVCSAGGLGSLPCALLSIDELRSELEAMKQQTDMPYSANFFCHQTPIVNAEREAKWRAQLKPYLAEFGMSVNDIPAAAKREPFNHAMADVLEQYKPAIVSFHFGLPAADLVNRVKGWGSTIIASATTLQEALWLEAHGADGIIAQGLEAGGHRGIFLSQDITTQIGSFALLPQIINQVKLPVIAAGGIADATGVAAALALGATAVQLGTAYLLCNETNTSQIHRAAIKSDASRHTAITNLFSGRPARSIVNRIMQEIGPINKNTSEFPLAITAISALRKQAESAGSGDFSSLWCGQNATGCKEISAAEMTRALAAQL